MHTFKPRINKGSLGGGMGCYGIRTGGKKGPSTWNSQSFPAEGYPEVSHEAGGLCVKWALPSLVGVVGRASPSALKALAINHRELGTQEPRRGRAHGDEAEGQAPREEGPGGEEGYSHSIIINRFSYLV